MQRIKKSIPAGGQELPSLSLRTDFKGKIISASQRLLQVTGKNTEELYGNMVDEVIGEDTDGLLAQIRSGNLTQPTHAEIKLNARTNKLHLQVHVIPVQNGEQYLDWNMEEILPPGSSNGIEQKLLAKTEELNMVVSSLDDVVFELDVEFRYQKVWCRDAELVFSPMPPNFLGKSIIEVFDTSTYLGKSLLSDFEYVKQTKSLTYRDYPVEKGDEIKWYNIKISPVFHQEGALKGFTKRITDISERKKVEIAVEEKNEQLRSAHQELADVIRNATEIIFKVDAHGLLLFVSAEFERSLGYSPKSAVGRKIHEFIHPDDLGACLDAFKEALVSKGSVHNLVYRAKGIDGSYRWFSTSGVFIYDNRGEPLYGLGFAQDVTQLQLANESLNLQARVLQDVSDSVVVTDLNFNIVAWNASAEKIYGISAEAAIGNRIRDIVSHGFLVGTAEDARNHLFQNDSWSGEVYFDRAGGRRVYLLSSVSYIKNERGERISVAAISRDITERRKSEESLRINEERYRSLVEALGEGILMYSNKGEVVACNRSAEDILGMTAEEMLGKTNSRPEGFKVLREDGAPYAPEEFPSVRTMSSGVSVQNAIVGMQKPGGPLTWLSVNTEPVFYSASREKPDAVVTSFVNITQKKEAEAELLRRQQQLHEYSARLSGILESITDGFVALDTNLGFLMVNNIFECVAGIDGKEVIGKKISDVLPELFGPSVIEQYNAALRDNTTLVREFFFESKQAWFETSAYPSSRGFFIYFKDTTERKKADALLSLEKQVLEINAEPGGTLRHTVDCLLEGLEKLFTGMRCSVLTLDSDNESLRHLSAPHLPPAYITAVDGLKIGPNTGSCGTAIYRKEPVIVENVFTSPLWTDYLSLIEPLGLRACWSFPIIDTDQKVLATIAAYFDRPCRPNSGEKAIFERIGNMLRIILQSKYAEATIRQANERYVLATMATNDAIWDWDVINDTLYWGEGFYNLFGHRGGTHVNRIGFWESSIHPQDRERVLNSLDVFFQKEKAQTWESEYRFLRADGKYVMVHDRGFLVYNLQGKISRMVGSMQDVTEKREMERKLLKQELNRQKLVAQAVVDAQEKERASIGKELHDNVNQILSTAKLYLELARNDEQERLSLIDMGVANIADAINEIRGISRSLVPSSIDDLGMVAAINDLVESIKATKRLHVEFYHRGEIDKALSEQQKLMLFRIAQEQVNNVLTHSKATNLIVELMLEDNAIFLTMSDNGRGFDYEKVKGKNGVGLSNIFSRAELFNGKVNLVTAPGKGCTLQVSVPISNL